MLYFQVSLYDSVEAGGGAQLPLLPSEMTVLSAINYAGCRIRLERAPSGALFVWERQVSVKLFALITPTATNCLACEIQPYGKKRSSKWHMGSIFC